MSVSSQYSYAVLQVIEDGMSAERALAALDTVLERRGHTKMKRRILDELAQQIEHRERDGYATLTVAQESDTRTAKREASKLLDAVNATEISETVIDESLIGGFTLATKTLRADRSHKRTLLNLYQRITTNN